MQYRLKLETDWAGGVFWNAIRSAALATVAEDGSLTVADTRLTFDKPEEQLPAGTEVRVWDHFGVMVMCRPQAEYLAEQAERQAQRAEKERQDKHRRQLQRAQAIATNGSLAIRARWEPAIKDVISGLTEGSMGNGRSQATVQHIRLLGTLKEGRLVRTPGMWLCVSRNGDQGQNWSNQQAEVFTDGERTYPAPITCKKCLQIASKFRPLAHDELAQYHFSYLQDAPREQGPPQTD